MTEVTLKNLKNEISKITVKSILEIKQHVIGKEHCELDQIKCIYKGRVLENDQTIEELNYDSAHYIVYMVSKTKSAPKVVKTEPKETKSEPGSPVKGKQANQSSEESDLLKGEALSKAVEEMKSMGFNEPDIVKAMKKAFNHPDRAIEYLLSGNLDVSEGPGAALSPLQPPEERPELNEEGIATEADQETQMEQLLQLMQSNPEVLSQLMQANPQMGQQILQYLQGMQQQDQTSPQQGIDNKY